MLQPMVRAFGPLRIELDGRTIGPRDVGGRKPKLLLEILLLADGHPVPRDRIAGLLWEEDLPRNVPGTIDTYVSVLRRTLGAHRDLLVTEHEAYRLDRSRLLVDLDRFDALRTRAAALPPGAQQRDLLEEALALADGELLEDEPYVEWLQEARAHHRRRVLDTQLAAGIANLVAKDTARALTHAEQVLDADAFDERAHRLAIVGHHLAGRRSAALDAYQRCREILAEELGTDPSEATEAVHVGLLRDQPARQLLAALGGDTGVSRTPTRAATRRGRALHVLLVEDTPAEAHLITGALEAGAVPIEVHHVVDGETALETLSHGQAYPDLVLLDLGLPGLSGHEVLDALKQDPAFRRIPVIMLTSSTAQTDVARSYDLHANSYVTKPTDPAEFTEVVRAIEAFWPLTASGVDPAEAADPGA